MKPPSKSKSSFAHGLGQGFAAALKKGVNASIERRGLGIGSRKSQDWLYRRKLMVDS